MVKWSQLRLCISFRLDICVIISHRVWNGNARNFWNKKNKKQKRNPHSVGEDTGLFLGWKMLRWDMKWFLHPGCFRERKPPSHMAGAEDRRDLQSCWKHEGWLKLHRTAWVMPSCLYERLSIATKLPRASIFEEDSSSFVLSATFLAVDHLRRKHWGIVEAGFTKRFDRGLCSPKGYLFSWQIWSHGLPEVSLISERNRSLQQHG